LEQNPYFKISGSVDTSTALREYNATRQMPLLAFNVNV